MHYIAPSHFSQHRNYFPVLEFILVSWAGWEIRFSHLLSPIENTTERDLMLFSDETALAIVLSIAATFAVLTSGVTWLAGAYFWPLAFSRNQLKPKCLSMWAYEAVSGFGLTSCATTVFAAMIGQIVLLAMGLTANDADPSIILVYLLAVYAISAAGTVGLVCWWIHA